MNDVGICYCCGFASKFIDVGYEKFEDCKDMLSIEGVDILIDSRENSFG